MDLLRKLLAFPGGSVVKNPPADAAVLILGCEDPLEEEMATHSSMLAWEKSMDRGTWLATVHGVTRSQA